ncbi:hypothetical protein AVEN_70191-1 [Araneus ventricosus]|uniref:Uncharacterized protein n=1 Tax=Araneus ventricosus TaxID=182803 RepID=A0A4Y2FBV1_ARAVE|nr:hypothetical protein AVEN_70191-1 [Araneus ventricosus]
MNRLFHLWNPQHLNERVMFETNPQTEMKARSSSTSENTPIVERLCAVGWKAHMSQRRETCSQNPFPSVGSGTNASESGITRKQMAVPISIIWKREKAVTHHLD